MIDQDSWCQKCSTLPSSGCFVRWPFSIPPKTIGISHHVVGHHLIPSVLKHSSTWSSLSFDVDMVFFVFFLCSYYHSFLLGSSNSWKKNSFLKNSCWCVVSSQGSFILSSNFPYLISVPASNIDSCVLTPPPCCFWNWSWILVKGCWKSV